MTAWTPGPWRVIEPDSNSQPVVSARDYEVATCWHHCVGSIEKEAHANAQLISAAPDLYEALKAMVDWYGKRTGVLGADELLPDYQQAPEVRCALAALRKAEGAS